jgi:16S rRNA A1518/A1519 N6-dimethyltransferase RsmA/KsgA/DIM1 with predicted DNA glycosylase/AP lyase activity
MSNFKDYAKYYDLFYKAKNYRKESRFIESFFPKKKIIELLDLGVGTGGHFINFLNNNYKIHGVELSSKMLNLVKKKINIKISKNRYKLFNNDILKFNYFKNKYEVAYSIFHVINYLKSYNELKTFFNMAHKNLSKNGILIFDVWNSQLIDNSILENSLRIVKHKNMEIQRNGKVKLLKKRRMFVNIEYTFKIFKKSFFYKKFTENHNLCIFSHNDIMKASKKFKIINLCTWFNKKKKPNKNDFSSFYVFKKI